MKVTLKHLPSRLHLRSAGTFLGVQLVKDSALIQTFRETAKGQEPARAETFVEKAKSDLANGLLGSDEDIEQAINALLQELAKSDTKGENMSSAGHEGQDKQPAEYLLEHLLETLYTTRIC